MGRLSCPKRDSNSSRVVVQFTFIYFVSMLVISPKNGGITNQPVPVTDGQRRPGDCTKLVYGSLRAKTELGWSEDRSNLKQIITDAWRWHQSGGYTK